MIMWRQRHFSRFVLPSISEVKHRMPDGFIHSSISQRTFYFFRDLAKCFAAIEMEKKSRDQSIKILSDGFQTISLDNGTNPFVELASAVSIASSELAPPHEGIELRFAEKTFIPIFSSLWSTDKDIISDAIRNAYTMTGDYGTSFRYIIENNVLPNCVELQCVEDTPLMISEVHNVLLRIAREEGTGSVARKQALATNLLQKCKSIEEMVYFIRLLAHQRLRIGIGRKSILQALAIAMIPSTENTDQQRKAWIDAISSGFARRPVFSEMTNLLLRMKQEITVSEDAIENKISAINRYTTPRVGIPVLTMSAYPVSTILDVIKRMEGKSMACEYKYDGARIQVHVEIDKSTKKLIVGRIFSRNLEDNTEKFGSLLPVIQEALIRRESVTSFILEGEVVAIDPSTSALLPFQVLQAKTTTEFKLFAFDLLVINGESLLERSFNERRQSLYDHFKAIPDVFAHVSSLDVICEPNMIMKTKQVIKDFFAKSVEDGCEGLMIKALEAPSGLYRAGARSYAWMKLKQDYLIAETRSNGEISKLGATSYGIFLPDTLDLVPIGAFEGKGRRSGVFGSFLMASYNEESGKFETIGKVGTGFTDDKLNTLTKRLRPHVMIHDSITDIPSMFNCDSTASKRPDVWLEPKEVWEIKATQLTLSPSYTCAQEKINDIEAFTSFRAKIKPKGLAMRFPRFVRMRPDKSPFQATLSEEIAEIYKTACKYIG